MMQNRQNLLKIERIVFFIFVILSFNNTFGLQKNEEKRQTLDEIVISYGYPIEKYEIETPDGYLLSLFRIPYGKNGPSQNKSAVFLQHGLLCSATDWIIAGPEKSLAYMLADKGYDVWLGNARGNTYSRKHIKWDPKKDRSKFWDFSWHEIAIYDTTTMIDFILKETKQDNLFHVGHSQGTTCFYVMVSSEPSYNKKIKAHFSLAPVAFMKNVFSPILRLGASLQETIHSFYKLVGRYEFLPNSKFLQEFAEVLCKENALSQTLCVNVLFILCGFNTKQTNTTLLPTIMQHIPAGASTRQLVHYAQLIESDHFRQWDYGKWGNIKAYLSINPPDYDLKKIETPIYLFYSKNDWMSAEKDVLRLSQLLPNVRGQFLNPDQKWNHLDYMFGIDAHKFVHEKIIEIMEEY